MGYKLYSDGGSRGNPGNAACAYFLFKDKELIDFGGKFLGTVTNNVAEYEALVLGLKSAKKLGIHDLESFLDSELVVKQLNGEYKISSPELKKLVSNVQNIKKDFDSITFIHVRREFNKNADKLVNIILDSLKS